MQQATHIEYIGIRAPHTCPFSGVRFERFGDVQPVDGVNATKMLAHPSVYRQAKGAAPVEKADSVDAELAAVEEAAQAKREADAKKETDTANVEQDIGMMGKDALVDFIQNQFQVKADKRLGVDALRTQAKTLAAQFGLNP